MFERYTEKARQVVVMAQAEARDLRHNYIGTEHLLLGLLRVEDGLASKILNEVGIDIDWSRQQVAQIIGVGDEVTTGQIPFTPRAKKVLELSLREALSLGHNYIGTEHVLLGLVRENEGVAAKMVKDRYDGGNDGIRNAVIRHLSDARRAAQEAPEQPATVVGAPGDAQTRARLAEALRELAAAADKVGRAAADYLETL